MILYPLKATKYTIGGKAAGLLRLKASGILIPDLLSIPAETFDPITSEFGDDIEVVTSKLSSFVLEASDKAQLEIILSKWNFPQSPVVVRSSVADEDGTENAFAGLMKSFINLTNIDDVCHAIAACAASAFSKPSVDYRQQKGLPIIARPAVIVQQQVDAEVSGVIFSTYPDYPQEMAIHAVLGFGEGLVIGQLEPDEFYLLKKDGRENRIKIANKQEQIVADGLKGTTTKLSG
jgi:pyruvate,water dikinase